VRRFSGSIEYDFFDSPYGQCLIACSDRGICHLDFVQAGRERALAGLTARFSGPALPNRSGELVEPGHEIFAPSRESGPDLDLCGTEFQIAVWNALMAIPRGTTTTYRAVAEILGQPRSVRAVAGAVAANRIAYAVPCHRVVRSDGSLGGFRWGRQLKVSLLAGENSSPIPPSARGNVIHRMA
jgi:AraC family transcriptional regulator of adaptative response/methylated-DNA-[protein]-cysteine methyltransferase